MTDKLGSVLSQLLRTGWATVHLDPDETLLDLGHRVVDRSFSVSHLANQLTRRSLA